MRYFFDTEFIEDGKAIDLISIGIVREDDANYYAQNMECDFSKASDWVRENVLTHLDDFNILNLQPDILNTDSVTYNHFWRSKYEIRDEILAFVGDDPDPVFWAYYADYDWVVLCQLFGTMMDLPKSWPMYCNDFKQLVKVLGNPNLNNLPVSNIEKHNALADAEWLQSVFFYLRSKYNNEDQIKIKDLFGKDS